MIQSVQHFALKVGLRAFWKGVSIFFPGPAGVAMVGKSILLDQQATVASLSNRTVTIQTNLDKEHRSFSKESLEAWSQEIDPACAESYGRQAALEKIHHFCDDSHEQGGSLELSDLGLTRLPAFIGTISKPRPPDFIGSPSKLVWLDLSGNQLKALPWTFGNLPLENMMIYFDEDLLPHLRRQLGLPGDEPILNRGRLTPAAIKAFRREADPKYQQIKAFLSGLI